MGGVGMSRSWADKYASGFYFFIEPFPYHILSIILNLKALMAFSVINLVKLNLETSILHNFVTVWTVK